MKAGWRRTLGGIPDVIQAQAGIQASTIRAAGNRILAFSRYDDLLSGFRGENIARVQRPADISALIRGRAYQPTYPE